MDKSELRMNNDGKPLKGLQDKGIIHFDCADCGRRLLELQLISIEKNNEPKVITRVVVRCDLCGGSSFVQQIVGQFYPGAPSDHMAFDILDGYDGAPEADVYFKAWNK